MENQVIENAYVGSEEIESVLTPVIRKELGAVFERIIGLQAILVHSQDGVLLGEVNRIGHIPDLEDLATIFPFISDQVKLWFHSAHIFSTIFFSL